jgi:hypothetical protein
MYIHMNKCINKQKNSHCSQTIVAQAYNPSFLGGRDQKNHNQPGQIIDRMLSPKYSPKNRAGRVPPMIEHWCTKS